MRTAAIVDAYTVEPSGLGVPPYLSSYVRNAYTALSSMPDVGDIDYFTIDDFRRSNGEGLEVSPYTDARTYSLTTNAPHIRERLSAVDVLVVVAGDAVPSVHLHAINASVDEVVAIAESATRAFKIVVGPMAAVFRNSRGRNRGVFDACHQQTFSNENMTLGSLTPLSYAALLTTTQDYTGLIEQIPWTVIAELELYRGCTRHAFCSFCNEPVKNPTVAHREPEDVLKEVGALYAAGVRHFRLGQQTCFFSYQGRDVEKIERLLAGVRETCPDLEVLHIDNVDPLAAASNKGREIARLVATYCTEGNAAPMGIETFDTEVVAANTLTCTPEIALRAIENMQEHGTEIGPLGFPKFLPGLNLIYGLPGETERTHDENLRWLGRIMDRGYQCHRTNVRAVRVYEGTALSLAGDARPTLSAERFGELSQEISSSYDTPMKQRVYPAGRVLRDMHEFFKDQRGTWFRRLGSYSIQVVDRGNADDWELYDHADVRIDAHEGRNLVGTAIRTG